MPIEIALHITVDERGVKMTSKGRPTKMNKVEEQVAIATMSVIKLFMEQTSQQIATSLKAAESADKLIKSVEETMEDADGIEGIKAAFLRDVAAKEGGAVIRGPDGQLIGGQQPADGVVDPTNIAGEQPSDPNVIQFPATNGDGTDAAGDSPKEG